MTLMIRIAAAICAVVLSLVFTGGRGTSEDLGTRTYYYTMNAGYEYSIRWTLKASLDPTNACTPCGENPDIPCGQPAAQRLHVIRADGSQSNIKSTNGIRVKFTLIPVPGLGTQLLVDVHPDDLTKKGMIRMPNTDVRRSAKVSSEGPDNTACPAQWEKLKQGFRDDIKTRGCGRKEAPVREGWWKWGRPASDGKFTLTLLFSKTWARFPACTFAPTVDPDPTNEVVFPWNTSNFPTHEWGIQVSHDYRAYPSGCTPSWDSCEVQKAEGYYLLFTQAPANAKRW